MQTEDVVLPALLVRYHQSDSDFQLLTIQGVKVMPEWGYQDVLHGACEAFGNI